MLRNWWSEVVRKMPSTTRAATTRANVAMKDVFDNHELVNLIADKAPIRFGVMNLKNVSKGGMMHNLVWRLQVSPIAKQGILTRSFVLQFSSNLAMLVMLILLKSKST